jgi:ribosomal-protein-alanine N-acetyltransferase
MSAKNSPDLVIRPLGRADLDAVHRLDALCFPPDIAFPREAFESCIADPRCDCFGIGGPPGLLAFAVVYPQGPRGLQIVTLDVHPNHRRRGLGQALMNEIEARARRDGRRRIYLQVAVDNQPARALYKKFGFTARTILPDYYGPRLHAWLMDKDYP